ncbi:hypothetical protein pneo_cds_986 [Pandoravirus neocaledonia]|uniref:Uncharacterized protein n=1 Tax=Pandoravirus neocaledonia TaxID=2107708 RepID=A0A2U7UDT4_9VIRU|nr:hypothetical protein pneo_cds_986 [Pandoravirus neocaledonia]AVK76593.1 hypothetical protein pneo_cds_986 [Pandoravirus neocaledonia]
MAQETNNRDAKAAVDKATWVHPMRIKAWRQRVIALATTETNSFDLYDILGDGDNDGIPRPGTDDVGTLEEALWMATASDSCLALCQLSLPCVADIVGALVESVAAPLGLTVVIDPCGLMPPRYHLLLSSSLNHCQ